MNIVWLNGEGMHLCGTLPSVGEKMPGFELVDRNLREVKSSDFAGKRLVLNIFPSLDTDVCATSVRRFNEEAAAMENTVVLCISKDLPFAASRFCSVSGIENVITLSAFRSGFGVNFGVEIVDGVMRELFARALIIVDAAGKVEKVALCRELTDEPDYSLALTK